MAVKRLNPAQSTGWEERPSQLCRWLCAPSKSVPYLAAARVALFSLPPQRVAGPHSSKPQADGTAGARPTLDIPLTGLRSTKGPLEPISATQEDPESKVHPKPLGC